MGMAFYHGVLLAVELQEVELGEDFENILERADRRALGVLGKARCLQGRPGPVGRTQMRRRGRAAVSGTGTTVCTQAVCPLPGSVFP